MAENTPIRSIMVILPELRQGNVIQEMSAGLHEAIAAVKSLGKPAEVTLTIKVARFNKDQQVVDPPITIVATVDTKLPKQEPPASLYFIDADGNPTQQPDRQRDLAFTVAGGSSSQANSQ